jgi:uncharacterized membrane protein YfhO
VINFIKKNIDFYFLLIAVFVTSIYILYKIPMEGLFYFSALGDTREQYIHFFNHYYDLIHSGQLPFWSWEYGMGGSFWNDFGYYMLGDIFVLPMFLFPKAWFPALFLPLSIFKVLLMSLGAYFFFNKIGIARQWAFLGALIYPFSGYHFDYFYTHFFFINAAVYFPFLLLGYERFLQNKKPGLLILIIFLASIGNFYLMFLLTIGLFIYAIYRYFNQSSVKKSFKEFFVFHLKLSLAYLSGIGLSMPFFLPSVLSYLQSNAQVRSGPEFELILTFEETLQRILTTGGMHYLVFAVVPLILAGLKTRYPLLILCGILWSIMQFPLLTSIIGGFSNPEEIRGFFIVNLLSLFVATQALNSMKRSIVDIIALFIGITFVVYTLFQHPYSRYEDLLLLLPIMWGLGILAYLFLRSNKIKYFVFAFSSLICLGYSATIAYSFVSDLIVKTQTNDTTTIKHKGIWSPLPLLDKKEYIISYKNESFTTTLSKMKQEDSSFYRIVANIPGVTAINSSLTYDYKSFYSYHSLIPWKQQQFEMDTMAQPGLRGFNLLRGFGNSTYLTTLFSNKYFLTQNNEDNISPKLYGYELKHTYEKINIFKNQFSLPFGFVYNKAMSTEQFLSLPVYQREQAMMNYAIIDNAPLISDLKLNNYVISDLNDININSINASPKVDKTVKSDKPIEIKVPTPITKEGQLYVYANIIPKTLNEGITINAKSDGLGDIKYEKNMRAGSLVLGQYHYDKTVNEVLFRFGNASAENKEVTLSLLPGEYIIEDIKVLLDPMDDYKKQVSLLRNNSLKDVKYNTYSITGNYKTSKDGILFLSIPYNKGWHAKIDNKKADILSAHYTYSGIPVTSGTHKIELYFIPPGLIPGGVIAIITIILVIYYYKRQIKNINVTKNYKI